MHQLLLGLIVMGMTLSSAFSVSFHTPAVRLAITLLMAPVIAMGLAFGAPPMVAVALLGVLLLALMLKQVGSHNRQLEENIGLRLNALNLTNKRYFDQAYPTHYAHQAAGRTVIGTLSVRY